MILYFAPGSGVGHLNRALAVCLELRRMGAEAEIVTNSPFAEGIAGVARFPIVHIGDWARGSREYLARRAPALAVFDTFPAGLRGEWIDAPRVPCVYVARRLRMDNYIAPESWPRFEMTITAEPLGPDHLAAIRGPMTALDGPIRLAPGEIATPVPPALDRLLDTSGLTLVIHSGPPAEIAALLAAAGSGPRALISPWESGFDYYPAGNLVRRARRVVSGAGYNMMADMVDLRERHLPIAFDRLYDDQAARIREAWSPGRDGTVQAARIIASFACLW